VSLADLSNAALVMGDVRGLSSASLSCPCPVAVEAPADVSRLLTPRVAGARVPGAYMCAAPKTRLRSRVPCR
jgi:hypothetical protein